MHDYCKNHIFDYLDFGRVKVLFYNMLSKFVIACLPGKKVSFIFMAAVTVHSDFGAQEKKVTATNVSYLFAMKRWNRMRQSFFFFLILNFKP